jgi:hypothetical protein
MIKRGGSLKKHKESVILYLKVFFVLFILGFILPNIIGFAINHLIIKPQIQPPKNYLFVTSNLNKSKSFYEVFLEILGKVIEF